MYDYLHMEIQRLVSVILMSEKRFLYRNFLGEEVEKRFTEEYDEHWGIYLSDNLTGDWYNINPVRIVDTCNELWEQVVKLGEENEELKQKLENLDLLNKKNNAVKMIDGKVFIRM